jgi:putative ABC transport system ATP-binding protein
VFDSGVHLGLESHAARARTSLSLMPPNLIDNEFSEEVLTAFASESSEWLLAMAEALRELERGTSRTLTRILTTFVRQHLITLKGSAATVNLASVEEVADQLLAELQVITAAKQPVFPPRYGKLRKPVEALAEANCILTHAKRKSDALHEFESKVEALAGIRQQTAEVNGTGGAPIMEVKNLRKVYREGTTDVVAVDGVSLSLQPGELLAVIGPSGSGKTTMLSMMGFLLTPTSGQILLHGEAIDSTKESRLPRLRREHIGFIFQGFNLLGALSAMENVMVSLRLKGITGAPARKEAADLLERVGLGKRKHFLPRDMSGGQKQRVAIARALAGSPSLILSDEPTANLDSASGQAVVKLMREVVTEGRSVVIVTHDHRLLNTVDRVIHLEDGRLIEDSDA